MAYKNILIIADIEGSSGCGSRSASEFLTPEWQRACVEMSRDVDAVVRALFEAGAGLVTVQDFHRTGYNLLPELIDGRARIRQGWKRGPVLGLGDPEEAEAVMFLGLHASSGTEGFLAHTLTSRLSGLEVNGRPISEAELFSASLASYGIRPIFFSGCPLACAQAARALPGIICHPLDRSNGFHPISWRRALAEAAARSLKNESAVPFAPEGPFTAVITLRDGPAAAEKIARRWNLKRSEDRIFLEAVDFSELFWKLARMAYLNRVTALMVGPSLFLYNLMGRLGRTWVRHRIGDGADDV